ncbi:hypothetical protein LU293_09135 [Moraxella nasovis]|uniref:hypothetical protein n=1 Tax=Moraxella nasovis TaxID=2904121 RepID=UPI001F60803F|nr:hypothetical protein [Moraxella nasovis]UNU73221.1 hypothetical protein LU293_09135 [Moraxella nasovis]
MKKLIKKAVKIGAATFAVQSAFKKNVAPRVRLMSLAVATTMTAVSLVSIEAYAMDESAVQDFVAKISKAANGQNKDQIGRLIDDEAIIVLSRNGDSATLTKQEYLARLQKNWAQASDYHYDIQVDNIVVSSDQARAQITTTESWKDKKTGNAVRHVMSSRSTLTEVNGKTVMLRAVAQVTVQ